MPSLPSSPDLASLIRDKARKNADRLAVRLPDGELTYRQLDRESDQVAAGLLSNGIRDGERLAVLLPNARAFPVLWFATAKVRAVLVPLNSALRGEVLRYELDDCRPRGVVIDARRWPAYQEVRSSTKIPMEWIWSDVGSEFEPPEGTRPWEDLGDYGDSVDLPPPEPWATASILYTSGTTGPPKGVVLPHRRLVNTPAEIGARARLDRDSVLFTTLPLFHCNAQEKTVLTAIAHDCTAAIADRFHATSYWETAANAGATHVTLLVSMINVLYKQPTRATDRDHGVRLALCSGTPADLWRPFEERFGVEILETYGMTECGCTTLMNPPDAIRVGSVGTPLGFVEADVVDDNDAPVPVGQRGELVVRPRAPFTMFSGYYRKPEATVEAWRNLWFHTGDFVTKDADGYYYFVDRKKDVIRRRGENVAPYDVEQVLNRYPTVVESVVVGVPSEVGEEDVKAFVRLKEGVAGSADEARRLFEWLSTELAFYMVPRYVEYVGEVPKTANEKAQRYRLKQARTLGGVQYDREALGLRGGPG